MKSFLIWWVTTSILIFGVLLLVNNHELYLSRIMYPYNFDVIFWALFKISVLFGFIISLLVICYEAIEQSERN